MADAVNSPSHYTHLPHGVEVIDLTEGMGFCLGNVIKYVMRCDHKGKPVEDLKKARWYLDREIARREGVTYDLRPGQRLATDEDVDEALDRLHAIHGEAEVTRQRADLKRSAPIAYACGKRNCGIRRVEVPE